MPGRLISLVIIWLASAGGFSNQIGAQDTIEAEKNRAEDSKLVEGLRRRRLFGLAEFYCQKQLARPGLDPTSQSTLVIELMKTQTSKAILSDPAERDITWNQVQETCSGFVQSNQDHPRKYLVQVQAALSHIAHGRLLGQEIAADMATESARDKALEEIRTARSLLSDLQRDIAKLIPEQGGRSLSEHDLTVEQLLNLNNNVRYQLAVCNLNRAQLYDQSDRLNRIDALNGVTARLSEVQRAASEGQPLWWKAKLGQLECLRLLGKSREAHAFADALPIKDIHPSTRQLLIEQKIRLAIELGDENYSRDILMEVEKLDSRTAQLELALIELAVDLSARSQTDERKQEWLTFASSTAAAIDSIHGAYWQRRADLVLIGAAGAATNAQLANDPIRIAPNQAAANSTNNIDLDLLIRLADESFRKELLDDALKAYTGASGIAVSLENKPLALQLDFRAGQVLEKQGKHELAAKRLIEGSLRDPKIEIASAAHLRGCWNFARTLSPDQPDREKTFEGHLADHLQTWPGETSANQVRVWLGHQLQARQQWETAFETYLQVATDSPQLQVAVDQMLICAKNVLQEERRAEKSTRSTAAKMIARFSENRNSLEDTDSIAMQLDLARAELELVFGSSRPKPEIVETLQAIVVSENSWSNYARAILVVFQCLETPDQATQLLTRIGNDERALDLCDRCLAAVVQRSELERGLDNALEARLVAIEQALNLPEFQKVENEPRRTNWLLRKSEVLTALNRQAESVVVLAELEKKFPRNANVQMQLARAMTIQLGTTDPVKPLAKWRKIASRLKSHTPNWYEAKYQVARLLDESGQKAEAAKLLRYLKAIPPGWETSELKPKFEQLLRHCESRE